MQKNVGGVDRIARLVVGPLLIVVGIASLVGWLALGAALAVLSLVVGAVLSVTAVTQMCPLNRLLGIDTFRGESETSSDAGTGDRTGQRAK